MRPLSCPCPPAPDSPPRRRAGRRRPGGHPRRPDQRGRQAGKSTLVRIVAGDRLAERRDLDRAQDRAAAIADPVGFVDSAGLMVIDEIQRVRTSCSPSRTASTPTPGPAATCSPARRALLALRGLPDTLPGRIETIELWPFSQGEIDGTPDGFVDAIFDAGGD